MLLIVDSFNTQLDRPLAVSEENELSNNESQDNAARLLLGARHYGELVNATDSLLVARDLVQTVAGRALALSAIVPANHCVTGAAALWVILGNIHPRVIHTVTTSRRSFDDVIAHRVLRVKTRKYVTLYGLMVALPIQVLKDTSRLQLDIDSNTVNRVILGTL